MKREGSFADTISRAMATIEARDAVRREFAKNRQALIQSTPMALDDDFTAMAVTAGAEGPWQIAKMLPSARLPFDKLFLSFSLDAKRTAAAKAGVHFLDRYDGPAMGLAGFLMESLNPQGTIWKAQLYQEPKGGLSRMSQVESEFIWFFSTTGQFPDLSGYRRINDTLMDHPGRDAAIRAIAEEHMVMTSDVLESVMNAEKDQRIHAVQSFGFQKVVLDGEQYNEVVESQIAQSVRMFLTPSMAAMLDSVKTESKARYSRLLIDIANDLDEMTGMMRFAVSALALINEANPTIVYRKGEGRTFYKGKLHRYMDQRTVSLHVPATKSITAYVSDLFDEVEARRRRHRVRGHWHHSHPDLPVGQKLCRGRPYVDHSWTELNASQDYCPRCTMRRTWVPEKWRGDASIGYVDQRYEIEGEPVRNSAPERRVPGDK